MSKTSITSAYQMKNWREKTMGPKPSEKNWADAHAVNGVGNVNTVALAQYMRSGGAHSGEVTAATGALVAGADGGPQLNRKNNLAKAGKITAVVLAKRDGRVVYKTELVKQATPKATKPKAKRKATKATK